MVFAGRGTATEPSCKQANACLLKALLFSKLPLIFPQPSRKTVAFARKRRRNALRRKCEATSIYAKRHLRRRGNRFTRKPLSQASPLVGLEGIEKFKKCLILACFCPILPCFRRKIKSCAKRVPIHTTSDSDLKNSRRLFANRRLNSYSIFLFRVSSSLWGRHRYRPGVCIMARTL